MDPTVALADVRQLVEMMRDTSITAAHRDAHAVRAVEKFEQLDEWLTPDPWGTHASLSALNGAISAGEAVTRKLTGDV